MIEQKQYALAWKMSERYCNKKGLSFDAFIAEWEHSGYAEIVGPINTVDENDKTTATITLHYPDLNTTYVIRYELIREPTQGSDIFGYWIFNTGQILQ